MTIINFFDINNPKHIKAFNRFNETGIWPEDFSKENLEDLEFPKHWRVTLIDKMAKAWIAQTLFESENQLIGVWEMYDSESSECIIFLTEEMAKNQELIYADDTPSFTKVSLSDEELEELKTEGYIWIYS